MSQTGYTPIQLYYSTTAAAVPVNTNLANGELAINITDGKLYYKDNTGTVKVIAGAGGAGVAGGSNTQVQYNSSGSLAGSANLTFNGTTLTANTLNLTNALGTTYGGTGLTSFTANGVVYASSTSALATGSALTFDGTNLAVTGGSVTAGSTQGNAQLIFGSVYGGIQFRNNTTAQSDVVGDTSGNLFSDFLTSAVWRNSLVGTNELMRLTSTGLGIGTSSPAQKLHVQKDQAAYTWARVDNQSSSASAYSGFMLGAFGNSWGLAMGSSAANSNALSFVLDAGGGNSEKMRLDSSGNLGLGVTPSAWVAYKAFQMQAGSLLSYSTNDWRMVQNTVRTGANFTYLSNGYASMYLQDGGSGGHVWYNAPSGTAGNAITFTQAMTLDASGNLLVGTTTAVSKVTSSAGAADGSIGYAGSFHANQGAGGDSSIQLGGNRSSGLASGAVSIINAKNSFGNGQLCLYTEGTERARIDSSGNFGIGLTSPQTALDVNGVITVRDGSLTGSGRVEITSTAFVGLTMASGNYVFKNSTNTSEYARINSSGYLLVGTTSNSGSTSNYQPVIAGTFRSFSGTVSAATNTYVTLFTAPSAFGSYMVTVWMYADDCVNYQANIIVNTQANGSAKLNVIVSGNLLTFQMSGYNVQCSQNSGGTNNLQYQAMRIGG